MGSVLNNPLVLTGIILGIVFAIVLAVVIVFIVKNYNSPENKEKRRVANFEKEKAIKAQKDAEDVAARVLAKKQKEEAAKKDPTVIKVKKKKNDLNSIINLSRTTSDKGDK